MTFVYQFYNEEGIREDHPPMVMDGLDVEQVASQNLLFDGHPYAVIEIVRDFKFKEFDDPMDLVKVRRKLH
jgi:hypothetical protein